VISSLLNLENLADLAHFILPSLSSIIVIRRYYYFFITDDCEELELLFFEFLPLFSLGFGFNGGLNEQIILNLAY
jgi:hypothetical protein